MANNSFTAELQLQSKQHIYRVETRFIPQNIQDVFQVERVPEIQKFNACYTGNHIPTPNG